LALDRQGRCGEYLAIVENTGSDQRNPLKKLIQIKLNKNIGLNAPFKVIKAASRR
jgi:hypothetical protein